ncbi:MAG: ATP-binding protein [Limisphaerales bacterium]
MNKQRLVADPQVLAAFRDYEHQARITNTRVGCFLVVALMPAGFSLDYFVYHDRLWAFFKLRLWCAAIAGTIWGALYTALGKRCSRWLGVIVPLLPVVFIAWMIKTTEGFDSPYYAGLNLVLLAVGAVLRWTFWESLVAVSLVLLIYITAGVWHGATATPRVFANNFYFILLMDVIVVVGTYFQHRQRLREFALRFELDRSGQMLEASNRKLVELDQLKGRFFANISHELRTPLTLLLAPLDALILEHGRAFDAATRELLATMRANGMRLLKLINDLLDLVRLESGKMAVRRERVEIAEFVRGLSNSIRKVAEDKRLRLETFVAEDVATILADRDKLEKILLNLLFNALKFTGAGGRVELRAERQTDELVLLVRDTGMGIAEAQLPFVFDRFWQADTSSQRKYQGVGIGLSLVKELVEVQNGQVTVESRVGHGTTFTVRLPYLHTPEAPTSEPANEPATGPATSEPVSAAATAEPAGAESNQWLTNLYRRAELFPAMTPLQDALRPVESPGDSRRPRALIADDEPDMLRFLRSQLGAHFQVFEAVDGQQAIEKAAQFLPDIILCDMMMPEKDGLQVCRAVRERTATQGIPIVLLTARADEETKLAALAAGASDFLTKPFSTTELHVRLKNLVESHQSQKKLAKQNQVLEATLEQLKDAQTQLVQSEKMASLGRLSAGIIHEINNPLNYARTGIHTLKTKGKYLSADQQADYDDILHDVQDGIDRVKNIVSDLRSFTHPSNDQFEPVALAEVVESALRFLSNEWKDKVPIETRVPELLTVRANENKLVQVLINLVQNALDSVTKKTFTEGGPAIWIEGRATDAKSLLVVHDNGSGIAPEHLDKVFDPFFTTKDVGEGMGLGLSISYRIVQEAGGNILVKSELGKFCEFTLEFPKEMT